LKYLLYFICGRQIKGRIQTVLAAPIQIFTVAIVVSNMKQQRGRAIFFFNFYNRVIVIGAVKITGTVPRFGPGKPSVGFGFGPRSFVTAVIHVGALGCWCGWWICCFLFLVAFCVVFGFCIAKCRVTKTIGFGTGPFGT
jgi:hypothetical protein